MSTGSSRQRTGELVARICAAHPMQARALTAAVAGLLVDEAEELEHYLSFCEKEGQHTEQMAEAYLTITNDTLREQVYFQRHGRYRHASFDSVASAVYFDSTYMSRYMYGLALTLYLWPNHLQLLRYFRRMLPARRGGRYIEIGPGHGAFFRHAVRHGGFAECLGVDISPTSLAMTRRLLESDAALPGARWRLLEADLLAAEDLGTDYDAVVMGEVLEHVEQPQRFLERIRDMAADGAFIYVTTAINAPAVDHIFLFKSVEEVTDMAAAAGLNVVDILATAYSGCTMEETVQRRLPINVALVLSR
jgi:2-polyprenyl-3-methyl-5-hydroxy-6-metoxy-1,4-benzoquinol methylase